MDLQKSVALDKAVIKHVLGLQIFSEKDFLRLRGPVKAGDLVEGLDGIYLCSTRYSAETRYSPSSSRDTAQVVLEKVCLTGRSARFIEELSKLAKCSPTDSMTLLLRPAEEICMAALRAFDF